MLICKKCGTIFGERDIRITKPRCPKCGSTDVFSTARKSLRDLDRELMPYRVVHGVDFRSVDFYKLAVFYDRTLKKDLVALHVPSGGDRCELLITEPPFKPYFFINRNDYRRNESFVDGVLAKNRGCIVWDEHAIGTDREPLLRVEFDDDLGRKSASIQLERGKICCYEANIPLTRRILMDLELRVKELPTRLFWDIEVDPRFSPGLQNTEGRVLCICAVNHDDEEFKFLLDEYADEDERRMLRDFFKLAFNYSVTCAFYGSRFDSPYTEARAWRLGIGWTWDFVNVMDMHNIYTVLQLSRWDIGKFDLETIAYNEFGIKAKPFEDYTTIWKWWSGGERDRLLEYCLQDAKILKMLDEKYSAIDGRLLACNLTYVRPDAYIAYMQGIESIVVKKLSERKPRVALYTPFRKRFEYSYEGALVFEPVPGLHSPVLVIDFKSMYNRIIRTFNIGIDTLDPNGEIETPTGIRFTNRFESCFSEALRELEKWREHYKKLRDSYPPYSEMWHVYDRYQWVVKYYLVSFYGVTGSSWSFLYNPKIAETITCFGRLCLTKAREVCEKMGVKVLYGDTDSLFVSPNLPPDDVDRLVKFGTKLADVIGNAVNEWASETYHVPNPEMKMELDKVFKALYFPGVKKRYFGYLVWMGEPVEPPRLYVAGFEARRTDWPPLCRAVQRRVMKMVLENRGTPEILGYVRRVVSGVLSGKYDLLLAIPKRVRKSLDKYKSMQPHVRAAKMWEAITGKKVMPSQEIKYFLAEDGDVIPLVDEEHVELPEKFRWYAVKQLRSMLSRMGINVADPMKKRLDEYF